MEINDINGKTGLLGLMGYPLGHTLSPKIHNSLSKELGKELIYMPFEVRPEDVEDAVAGAFALNIRGLNVTVPHKQAVIPYLKDIDPIAEKIGAVNTLVRDGEKNGYKGYNTDILGLKRQLSEEAIEISNRRCVIIGAGGAARAITFMLADNGAKEIYILNRTEDKAKELSDNINSSFEKDVAKGLSINEWSVISESGADKDILCIQATSVGMYPNVENCPIEDEGFFEMIGDAVDIIYNPAETMFLKKAKEHGARAFNGLKMLLFQGVTAYELWNGISVPDETVKVIYDELSGGIG